MATKQKPLRTLSNLEQSNSNVYTFLSINIYLPLISLGKVNSRPSYRCAFIKLDICSILLSLKQYKIFQKPKLIVLQYFVCLSNLLVSLRILASQIVVNKVVIENAY